VRELAHRLGVAKSRFPTLNRADEKCILCGMCVRVCHELVGASAIGFASRGKDRRVDSPFSLGSEDCLGCCACVAVCPTDSIVVRIGADTLMLLPFKTIVKLARCAVCGKPVTPQPLLALVKSRLPFCEWNPLTPSPSLTGGEGARRAGEGDTFGSKNWCPNLCADCKRAQAAQAQAAVAAQRRGKS
jgi:formate hydrogenlyase subunit 6/NADH:ubiquinone oxidoreductase subunit I